jgi:hypothetical protein
MPKAALTPWGRSRLIQTGFDYDAGPVRRCCCYCCCCCCGVWAVAASARTSVVDSWGMRGASSARQWHRQHGRLAANIPFLHMAHCPPPNPSRSSALGDASLLPTLTGQWSGYEAVQTSRRHGGKFRGTSCPKTPTNHPNPPLISRE